MTGDEKPRSDESDGVGLERSGNDAETRTVKGKEKSGKNGVRKLGSWRDDGVPAEDIPLIAYGDRASKVRAIADSMRALKWRSGHTAAYARAWGAGEDYIRKVAEEAHRVVATEVSDPSRATTTVVGYLEAALHAAYQQGDWRAVGDLSRTWSTIVGSTAPARVQVTALVADLSKLSADELKVRARELAEAVGRRVALEGQAVGELASGQPDQEADRQTVSKDRGTR